MDEISSLRDRAHYNYFMPRRLSLSVGVLALFAVISFGTASKTHAGAWGQPALAGSPVDLINAVNALRLSYGLPPYTINPILMAAAQAQADYLALTGTMTHSGPGGIGLTDRLLAAGYPLAGDLSLGGFRSENITGGPESMPVAMAVQRWTGDAPHLNTMVSPDLTEIGAGVTVNNGRVYYVIDCARPTDTGLPQSPANSVEGGSVPPPASPVGIIYPVSMSTPNADGDLIHEVRPGQSLWQIAIAYDTKIDEIRRLNNRFDDSIFPGENLLIRKGALTPLPEDSPARRASGTVTRLPSPTIALQSVTPALTVTPLAAAPAGPGNGTAGTMTVVLGIIALALFGGGILTWLGSAKKR